MPQLTLIDAQGAATLLDVDAGLTVLQIAGGVGLPGIVGECGGSAMCATCHVYVDAAWLAALPPPDAAEREMLDCTACERTPASRLACQIRVTDTLDGLVLHLPESQY